VETIFSTIQTLSSNLAANLASVDGIRTIYLFGSAVDSNTPNDVDLAIVYEAPLTPLSAPDVRQAIEESVRKSFGLPSHLTFFTPAEGAASPLLDKSKIVYQRT
jgi:predicted nucleotidyltransferase